MTDNSEEARFGRMVASGQATLDKIVAAATAFVDVEFDGPPVFRIGSTDYVALCSHGIKPQGEEAPAFGWQEALEMYGQQLRNYCTANANKQLAWRIRPEFRIEPPTDGQSLPQFRVYSRLAFI